MHRVQRVPATEASGRIHTSTATVAVLPEAEEVDIQVDEKDLRVDTFCSSGPGGQSVNTTYSAVRITHIPTGLVVSQQDEKSQIKNRAKAMKVLRSRLYEMEMRKQQEAIAKDRKTQVGTGERSEKIRTYNFRENRITDHRIHYTMHQLTDALDGNIAELIDQAVTHDQSQKLNESSDGRDPPTHRSQAAQPAPGFHDDPAQTIAAARRQLEAAGIAPVPPALDAEVLARTSSAGTARSCCHATATPRPPPSTSVISPDRPARAARAGRADHGQPRVLGPRLRGHPAILVPRPETELIVEEALVARRDRAARQSSTSAPAAAASRSRWRRASPRLVVATDISPRRSVVARGNARRHGVRDRVHFVRADLQRRLRMQADLIVSNPPTCPTGIAATLQPDVVRLRAGDGAVRRPDGLTSSNGCSPRSRHGLPGGAAHC